jgi:hypothetical protein
MRYLSNFLFFFLIACTLTAANSRSLEWERTMNGGKVQIDFQGSIHSDVEALPVFYELFHPEQNATAYNVRILYPVFQKMSSEEVRLLKSSLINCPDSIQVHVSVGMERKKSVLDLSFSPFVKRMGDYYKLLSFDWSIEALASATAVRASASATLRSTEANATESKLATGTWKKISVTESGMYKLTYSDIVKMGIDPEKVQIYGYGGKLLTEDFSQGDYLDDLPEVAVYKYLGDDGNFNGSDYLLFYAQGPIAWKYSSSYGLYVRERNHYSDKAYYFVGERDDSTLTAQLSTFSGTSNKTVTSFTDFLLHESEKVNMGESVSGEGTGRELYGEDFTSDASQIFTFDVPNVDKTVTSKLQSEFVVNNNGASSCILFVDSTSKATFSFAAIASSDSYNYGYASNKVVSYTPKQDKVTVQLDYYKNGDSSKHRAYLNYILLNARRYLKMTGSVMSFRDPNSVGTGNIGHFVLQNATANTRVFDVTDRQNMVQMNLTQSGDNYVFDNTTATLHEYVAVNLDGTFSKPVIEGAVTNQNIHASSPIDMVIVAPSEYMPYARKLAQAHQTHDNITTLLVTPEQVFNEFSSGTPDATAIRRMMKFFYDRDADADEMPKYLLLFGDGVYDNRLVSTAFVNDNSKPNKILTYESTESLSNYYSYVTDDYYGFLDDTEGSSITTAKLDIGIGRFPVSSVEEASIAVEKTIAYMNNSSKGSWKNRLLYLADDGDEESYIHVISADELAEAVVAEHPEFMVNKIYEDTYTKVTTTSGTTVPDANNRFAELLDAGLLMLNYTGHGSTTQWTDEKLLTLSEIKAMTNKHLPLWVTATCDFCRYDATETSGGEYVFLNENGGGIALFTTTRIVYSSQNSLLNEAFADYIFSKSNGVRYALGDIMRFAKCSSILSADRNKLSFTLIGDPALKLGYPEYSAEVTQVNGVDITAVPDTFQALSTVTISGRIYQEDGDFASDFNGVLYPTVMDARELVSELSVSSSKTLEIYDRSKVLFSGKDSVVNGEFSFSFIVPKDNSYSFDSGYLNLYAYDDEGVNEAQGSFEGFVLGGTDANATIDSVGPAISLFLNDESYREGQKVNETPTFIARISDENGLNTSGNGIGHDLVLTIDGKSSMLYNLNSYFSADIGSYTSGVVWYVLPDELTAGKHYLTFRAWDMQNNSSIDTLSFVVDPGLSASISDIRYAQSGESAWFVFTHNRPVALEKVKLDIYDLLGRIVWTTSWSMQSEDNQSDTIEWDLTDIMGHRIANGIYICKVQLTDANDAQTYSAQKIRVAAQ